MFVEAIELEADPTPYVGSESIQVGEPFPGDQSNDAFTEDAVDKDAETRNITAPIVLVCVIIAAFVVFMAFRLKSKKK